MTGKQDITINLIDEGYAAISWASSPAVKAQFRAALEAARRVGSEVTEAELSAMLWAAHNAEPEPDATGKTRVKRELKFEPEGGDDNELPASFRLETWLTPQAKDGRVAGGWAGTGPGLRTVLADKIGRRELERLLADGISCLAWDGGMG
jgi:hypothetical protein